jgi:prepilin-type processing-associated H-X9-DG protein
MGDCGWRGGFVFGHDNPNSDRSQPYDQPNPPPRDSQRGPGKAMANFAMDRHSGGINMCFMDGSTRKVAIKELWTLNWSKDWEPCNIYTECGENSYDWPEWMRNYPSY